MNASLDLLATKLYRAVLARQLFIGQRHDLQADTVDAIDHQLITHLDGLSDQYLWAGGTQTGMHDIIARASNDASAQLNA